MSGHDVTPVPRATSSSGGVHAAGALTRWLIHHAARRLPQDLSARLEEEWRADVAVRSTTISQLRFALGCYWATRLIVRELGPTSVPVTSAAVGASVTIGYTSDESGISARRSLTLFLVAGLHIVLFYALLTGLTFNIIKVMPSSLQTRLLQPPHESTLPPLPPPQLTKSIIEVPRPEFPPTEGPIDIVAETHSTPSFGLETPAESTVHEVIRVPGGPGIGFPNTDDYYPSIAKRMEEQGVTTIHVCVDTNGRLASAPTIAQTSGSSRLDDGALLLAKAGSGHYRAATENGQPVNSCYSFRVRFALRAER